MNDWIAPMSSTSRKLSLHASALSDDEYQFYTTSLLSILSVEDNDEQSTDMDDAYYEKMNMNVREIRAWLRGRYSHIPSLVIDKILKLFSPNLSAADSLSGGGFFAVLRLVVHVENGKEVDRSLAFVQAQVGGPVNSAPPRRVHMDPSLASSASSVAGSSSSHNPFTSASTPHPQPPLHPSQRSESLPSHNPFVPRTLPTRSEDGNAKLPPLPPRKPLLPQSPSMATVPSKHVTLSHNRSRSPSKLVSNPLLPSHSLPPTIPPKPIHHITSTLIKQSLQATKAAQTMKKAEEQLERERVMQVLKSSSTVSGTNVYNQHQYQQQQRSPSPMLDHGPGGGGGGLNRNTGYAVSSTSSGSDECAPKLPKRRTQQPSPPLSTSSLEQVALATTHPHPTSAPPSSTASAFSNPESAGNAHIHAYPNTTSTFRSRSRVPVDSMLYVSSPEHSPKRTSLDLPSGPTRGRPPPTHPDRKPHHLQHQYNSYPNSHTPSQSQSYPDPFSGNNLDPERATNVDESFESIYGASPVHNSSPFTNPFPPAATPTAPNPNRASRSKSLHQTSSHGLPVPRSSMGRKRPESVQVFRASDIEIEVDRNESTDPSLNRNRGSISRHTSLMMTPSNSNSHNIHRRSSLSISSTPSSSSSTSLNHVSNWPPPSPHGHIQLGSSSSSVTLTSPPVAPRPPSSVSSSTTTKQHDHSNPLTSLQKTFLQIQPHLDKARYKAEAGLSKRGFVRDGLRTRSKSSGSGGLDGDGDEDDGLEDGLEGLMGGSSDGGGGNKQVGMSRWRSVQRNGNGGGSSGYNGEVDQDSDWTRRKGMSMPQVGRVQHQQYSDGSEEDGDELEKDNLKWPVGEGWKPL